MAGDKNVDRSPFLLQAAIIETRIKRDLGKEACQNRPCLRDQGKASIIATVTSMARTAITQVAGKMDAHERDGIARAFGELATSERLKGWCPGCTR